MDTRTQYTVCTDIYNKSCYAKVTHATWHVAYVMSRPAMPRHVMSYNFMPCHVMSR